ncbi:MAG TPA: Calx-beta domain-containing protein, partial [Candidatus Acidoferrum sp.]|nr:Calx-beta domain-containing protein [Candidatus Acidoferrum sp.]
LNIVDNAGSIAFSAVTYTVVENDGNAILNLVRTGGSNGTVSVNWAVIGGTAIAGQDFFGASGTVVFANGETQKAIILPINNDTAVEGIETATLALSGAAGGARVGSPSSAVLRIIDGDAGVIIAAGSALISESFPSANNIIESNEVVTLLLALRNVGVVDDNVTATLVYSNGTGVAPTNALAAANLQQQTYTNLIAGGTPISRPFTFRASGANGTRLAVTLLLTNAAGVFLGDVTFEFTIGRHTVPFQNANAIIINDPDGSAPMAPASPYPSTITVSGVGGPVNGLTVTLFNITHNYPDDLDILLIAPDGRRVMLMSDAGLGGTGTPNALNNATITFDDAAAVQIPDSGVISNGTYRCANWSTINDPMTGFPLGTAFGNTSLATFNGMNPNGVWSLYIVDDKDQDAGIIANGWSLNILTEQPVIPGADLALSVTDSPDPVITNGVITYTVAVTNFGPASANAVSVTSTLPPGAQLLSATPSGSQSPSTVTMNFGSIASGSGAIGTITVRAPGSAASLAFNATVDAGEEDLNTVNNTVSIQTTVNDPAAPLPPTATLVAARSGSNLMLSWQTQTNVVLEVRGTMWSGSWATSPNAVTTNNGVSTVTVPLSSGSSFFRLRRVP